ncbi:nucleotide sugar dehydrogenase [Gilvimarinus sp. SDUM040013]|uniref:Nucleotide sugar dehydrogenase n=1 Tax=Gilvimarinus gilvus TaxID=3058038 RepID=A0ABU4S002_9GAMM|nr:nucleotide sugar dehydrogenase [Gilvimarinus sp. SDUM040013]MDO3386017.1 nucleotide sugar dehydrogenase [Gilvimarinus sp. SDUM040013]MDX6850471.1 nucleotide sugar dehydrogenase [Gilvimarinus sp. SDUM040013]
MSLKNSVDCLEVLEDRIRKRECVVGIFGLGYVGLPLAMCFTYAGVKVVGFDIDPKKISILSGGKSYISTVSDLQVAEALNLGFSATSDYKAASELDSILICVPTPLNQYRQPDLSFVEKTLDALRPYIRKGQVLGLESTTWPGTTEEVVVPAVESTGLSVGSDIAVVYSPEREDPGNQEYSTANIPKIIGGATSRCLRVGKALYEIGVQEMVEVSSLKVAEMSKLLENIHRAVNIGLVNEMKIVSDKMGININEVIDAASTKPFGFVPYRPGPGLGGHCLPIDPFYLAWKAREYGVNTRFIELAGEINHYMPMWVIEKVSSVLNNYGKAIKGSSILVLGIAYKKNINDTRESPAIELIDQLSKMGALISYSDPYVPKFPKKRRYSYSLTSVDLCSRTLRSFDCIVIATDHDVFDYDLIEKSSNFVIDTRNRINRGPRCIHA